MMSPKEINKRIKEAYLRGAEDALYTFAWMKDGVFYVGTTGTTLKSAKRELREEKLFYVSFDKISELLVYEDE